MAARGDEAGAELILIHVLEWAGRHARLLLLSGLLVIPFLPIPHAAFVPLLPLLIALLIGLALSRLDLASIMSDLTDPRYLPALIVGMALFQIGAALLLTGLGERAGFSSGTLLVLAAFCAAPVLNSAGNIALMLGYEARLALYWMLASNMLAPLFVPLALSASGIDLSVEPARIALRVAVILLGGIAIGVALRRILGPNRIAAQGKALDGLGALVMMAFLFPLMDGVREKAMAQPGLALWLALLALALNLGANLLIRALAARPFGQAKARTLGLVFGNRNIALMLAALPPDPTFSLFVAMAQIPIYASPIILRALDRPEPG
ncbi:hypothetical protein [Paracoccus albus]|uniref:hypothetical protein n=1 Tax=Paracoccus albus TaxID=3017784 RepID=UPI0022F07DDA|nr:hypothetical protein [Paracoccus albus]WBU59302.1 hypothetical protein PAF20_11015 [Paracoccus albus]